MRRFVPDYDHDAIDRATSISRKLAPGRGRLQVRNALFRRSGPDRPVPPASSLLRRSESYFKLQLALLWLAGADGTPTDRLSPTETRDLRSRPEPGPQLVDRAHGVARLVPSDPHTLFLPLDDLARLLGLARPKSGASTVRRGLQHLAAEGLILQDRRPGRRAGCQLLTEDGQRRAYKRPGKGPPDERAEGNHISLPIAFTVNGWLATLSGRALLVLLILQHQQNVNPNGPAWLAPRIRDELFAISEDTFSRGAAELEYHGVIRRGRQVVGPNGRYRRHTFTLRAESAFREQPV